MPPINFNAPIKYIYVHILQLRYHPRSFIACLKIISFSNPFCQLCHRMKPSKRNGYRRKASIDFYYQKSICVKKFRLDNVDSTFYWLIVKAIYQ